MAHYLFSNNLFQMKQHSNFKGAAIGTILIYFGLALYHLFIIFSPSASSRGLTQTLDLQMLRGVLYHCATSTGKALGVYTVKKCI